MRYIIKHIIKIIILLICSIMIINAILLMKTENFANQNETDTDITKLFSVVSTLKRLNGFLSNSGNWKERFDMIGKTPVELARHYLKSQQKIE